MPGRPLQTSALRVQVPSIHIQAVAQIPIPNYWVLGPKTLYTPYTPIYLV